MRRRFGQEGAAAASRRPVVPGPARAMSILGCSILLISACVAEPDARGVDTRPQVLRVLDSVAPSVPAESSGERSVRMVGRTEFWQEHGIALRARAQEPWIPPNHAPELLLEVENHGLHAIEIVVRRKRSRLPWSGTDEASAIVDLHRETVGVGVGTHSTNDRLGIDLFDENWKLEPGTRQRFVLPLPAMEGRLDYGVFRARVTLFPLAVRIGEDSERFVALEFPEVKVQVGSQRAIAWDDPENWPQSLDGVLAAEPRAALAWALRRRNESPIRVVDLLSARLPGRNAVARAALLAALQRTTELDLGDRVETWQAWWSSTAGARWASGVRREER